MDPAKERATLIGFPDAFGVHERVAAVEKVMSEQFPQFNTWRLIVFSLVHIQIEYPQK